MLIQIQKKTYLILNQKMIELKKELIEHGKMLIDQEQKLTSLKK